MLNNDYVQTLLLLLSLLVVLLLIYVDCVTSFNVAISKV